MKYFNLYFAFFSLCIACTWDASAWGADQPWATSVQVGALAPNAGGQAVYTIREYHAKREYSVIANTYLSAGKYPLAAGIYSWRFPLCGEECWWQFHSQVGAGFSTAGPVVELLWGSILPVAPLWLPRAGPKYFPAIRIDFATHLIAIPYRVVMWSYPLWIGMTVAI